MLRSRHVLPLALLISIPAVAMEKGKLIPAAAQAQAAPSADLLSTVVLADAHKSSTDTLATLQQQKLTLANAEAAKNQELLALTAQIKEKLVAKQEQIQGSNSILMSLRSDLAGLPAKTEDEIATIKANAVKKEVELQNRITKEEATKARLETEAAKLQEQISPKVEGPAEAPAKPWYRFGF